MSFNVEEIQTISKIEYPCHSLLITNDKYLLSCVTASCLGFICLFDNKVFYCS